MNLLGWLGVAMAAAGVVIALLAGALTLPAILATRSRVRLVAANVEVRLEEIQLLDERRRLELADLEVSLLPVRTLLRWLRHPLVVALLDSYRRRRAQG